MAPCFPLGPEHLPVLGNPVIPPTQGLFSNTTLNLYVFFYPSLFDKLVMVKTNLYVPAFVILDVFTLREGVLVTAYIVLITALTVSTSGIYVKIVESITELLL